jgi:hypothetical protein
MGRQLGLGKLDAFIKNSWHRLAANVRYSNHLRAWNLIRIWAKHCQWRTFGKQWHQLAADVRYSDHTQGGDLNRMRDKRG